MKTLSLDEIAKAGMRLRTVNGLPAIPRPPEPEPEKPDPLLDYLPVLTKTLDNLRAAVLSMKPESNEALLACMEELVKCVRELAPVPAVAPAPAPVEQGPETWDCVPEYDARGNIKNVRITRI